MKTTKILMLAALASPSIGAGTAMAQEADSQYLSPRQLPAPTAQWVPSASGVPATAPQAGGMTTMFGTSHRTGDVVIYDGSDGSA